MVSVIRLAATRVSAYLECDAIYLPTGAMTLHRILYLAPSLAKVSVKPTMASLAAE